MRGPQPGLEIRVLGSVEAVIAGAVVEITSSKQAALLVALALEPGTVVSSERLVDALWGDDPPETAQTTLRSLVYRLRRVLAGAGDASGDDEAGWLRARGSGYVLEVGPDAVDATRFDQLVAAGRDALARAEPAVAADALRQALELWRGAALAEFGSWPFFCAQGRRLEEARLGALEDLAEAELALGRPRDALARLEPHVDANPLRERAWGQLMLALYRLGRQADALRAYQQVRHVLAEELGIEPTPALRDLEAGILQHRPELLLPTEEPATGGPASPAPRGFGDTVAFLFTDIESSTQRWEGDQDAMAADLARHDKLLSEACESWGGQLFSHTGDGLCAAFPTAAAAIGAAVTGQSTLRQEHWSHEPLRVRMAVHVGAAECRAGNYFGPTLNRAARLLAVSWGGQIVCSTAAADLATDHLPEKVSLVDLGEQRLADLARPERVFQVAHPGLPVDFPPLRTAGARRHNLPAALTSFVGRVAEIDTVVGLLGGSRLVSVVGPGGAGKTRLALEAAAAVLSRFPDGVWLAELAGRDPAAVAHTVATAVGLDPIALAGSGRAMDDALVDQLRYRRLLVILDNCEHLMAAAAGLAHTILSRCPDITILATSREVLGLPGEAVVRLGSLSMPPRGATNADDVAGSDAVRLFCERARESVPGFALTEANAGAIARICYRLDGIPLALELAAGRTRLLGAQRLADRLEDRIQLLAEGPRTAHARHRTLQAALDWSYELLSDAERTVLRRLAVFPSDFSLEAAEAVCAQADNLDGPETLEVLDVIGRLADKSLVVASPEEDGTEVRFRLLETVREYAAHRLADAGETSTVRLRHRCYFTVKGDWLPDVMSARRLRWAATESDNVLAALEWAWEQGDSEAVARLAVPQFLYWFFAGMPDAVEWLERAVSAPLPDEPFLRIEARLGLNTVLVNVGDPDSVTRSVTMRKEALALAVESGYELGAAWARMNRAQAVGAQGRLEASDALAREALEALPPGVSESLEALGHILQAAAAMGRGDLDSARDHGERAVALVENTDDYVLAHALGQMAVLDAVSDDDDGAERYAARAVSAAREIPGRRPLVMALVRSAQAATISGRAEAARDQLDELLGVLRELGGPGWVAEALELTAIAQASERPAAAATLLGSAMAIRGSLREEAGALAVLTDRLRSCRAQVATVLGDDAAAQRERTGATMHTAEILAYARAELRAITNVPSD